MEDFSLLWGLGVLSILLVLAFMAMGVLSSRRDRRSAAAEASRLQAYRIKQEAETARAAAIAAAESGAAARVKLGVVAFFVVVAGFVWLGFVGVNAVQEWGEARRYRSRQATLTELDYNRTIRHGQLMEMMTNRAWAEAYRGRSGSPPNVVVWIMFLALAFFIGVNVWAYKKTGRVPVVDAIVNMGGPRGPPRV